MNRYSTKAVKVKNIVIGNGNPIVIQSMCNTDTKDTKSTIKQIKELESAGCEMVRVAVPDIKAATSICEIKQNISIPIVADIHFDYRLAVEAIKQGVDKIRINPGNIGDKNKTRIVAEMANKKEIPIRIGVNSGSLKKELIDKFGGVTPEAMVESALEHIKILEDYDFKNIIVSLKSSSVPFTIKAYTLLSQAVNYPLHVGITEAGTTYSGTIKSAVGIGSVLSLGIGDTIRVSLTGEPVEEIHAAKEILKSLEIRKFGVEIISCPTCGRTKIELISIANEVEKRCKVIDKNIKVAVMGCAVNGPGEAKEADIGIAGGDGEGLIFKKGKIFKKVPEKDIINALMKEIETL